MTDDAVEAAPNPQDTQGAPATDDWLWIGVNAEGVEDLGTIHVDEADCRNAIDKIYGSRYALTARRCRLVYEEEQP